MKHGDFTQLAKHYHNRPAYSPLLLSKLIACINDDGKSAQNLQVVPTPIPAAATLGQPPV